MYAVSKPIKKTLLKFFTFLDSILKTISSAMKQENWQLM